MKTSKFSPTLPKYSRSMELKQDCAFMAIPLTITDELVNKLNNAKLKTRKYELWCYNSLNTNTLIRLL